MSKTCKKCGETFNAGVYCPMCGGEGTVDSEEAKRIIENREKEISGGMTLEKKQYLEDMFGLKTRHFVIAWITLIMGIILLVITFVMFSNIGAVSASLHVITLSASACSIGLSLGRVICIKPLWDFDKGTRHIFYKNAENLQPSDFVNGLNKLVLWLYFFVDIGLLVYIGIFHYSLFL